MGLPSPEMAMGSTQGEQGSWRLSLFRRSWLLDSATAVLAPESPTPLLAAEDRRRLCWAQLQEGSTRWRRVVGEY